MVELTAAERGFLLLTSHLGDPERKPLTVAQLRMLSKRMQTAQPQEPDRDLTYRDLMRLGCGRELSERIVSLLAQEDLLDHYLKKGMKAGCIPVTRISDNYPLILRHRLGPDSPGCLWVKGDAALLNTPAISLVGSRELREENREFARNVGFQAAKQGLTLVSGNARGADRESQNACLKAGGRVISIVADELEKHPAAENVLYVSEQEFDEGFSAQRALSRNRCIHALGRMTFVAQATVEKGGTWSGTVKNLHSGWSNVAVFRDGSEASRRLEAMGAYLIDVADLADFGILPQETESLFDR